MKLELEPNSSSKSSSLVTTPYYFFLVGCSSCWCAHISLTRDCCSVHCLTDLLCSLSSVTPTSLPDGHFQKMEHISPNRSNAKISYNFPPLEIVSRPPKVVSTSVCVLPVKLSHKRVISLIGAHGHSVTRKGMGLPGADWERQQLGTDGVLREDTPFSIFLILPDPSRLQINPFSKKPPWMDIWSI